MGDTGKQYLFDVQRTWKEAYDNARRILYRKQQQRVKTASSLPRRTEPTLADETPDTQERLAGLQDRLQVISDALTCQVCFDQPLEVAFVPCGHQVCCKDCAKRCSSCPICRQDITSGLTVFLPVSRDYVLNGDHKEKKDMTSSEGDTVTSSDNIVTSSPNINQHFS